jgi:hypothetical protein
LEANLVNAASHANPQKVSGAASMIVLKKAMNVQAQGAMALLESLPEPPRYNNPPGVGQSVDVKV